MSGAKELSNTSSANRFRHRSFKSRVEDVQIHVGKRIGKVTEEPEAGGSFFTESLNSWKELNCTTDFTRYVRVADRHAGSLPVLLYNKEKVVATLLEHMSVPNSTALEPLLNLTTMLARDLQDEFFPYFESVVSTITSLLKYKDPAVIEAAFNAIAYLFKYLSKQLAFDLTPAFDLLAPLMGQKSAKGCTISANAHYAQHITLFAAESFAYLLRKAPRPISEDERKSHPNKSLTEVAQHMLRTLREDRSVDEGSSAVAFEEGMACVFAETAKSVGNRLHSRAAEVLRAIVHCLGDVEDAADPAFTLVEHTFRILCNHTKREFIEPLWDVLTSEAKSFIEQAKDQDPNSASLMVQTGKLLSLFSVCAASRKGARIPQEQERLQQIVDMMKTFSEYIFDYNVGTEAQNQARTFAMSHMQSFILSLIVFVPFSDFIQSVKPLLELYINRADPEEAISLCVALSRAEWSSYASIMPAYVHTSITRCWSKGSKNAVLLALEEGVEKGMLFGEHGSANSGELLATGMLTMDGLLKFRSAQSTESVVDGVVSIIQSASKEKNWIAAAFPALSLEPNSSPQQIGQVISALTVLPKLAIPHTDAMQVLVDFINSTVQQLDGSELMDTLEQNDIVAHGGPAYAAEILIGRALESLTIVYKRSTRTNPSSQKQAKKSKNLSTESSPTDEKTQNLVVTSICHVLQKRAFNGSPALLLGAASYLTAVNSSNFTKGQRILSEEKLRCLGPHIIPLISSHCRESRLGALRILAAFDQLHMEAEKETTGDPCPVLQMALDFAEKDLTVTEYRDKVMLLKKLANFVSLGGVPKFYEEVLPRLCVGTLTLNFQPMWQPAIEILDTCVKSSQSVVWGIIHAQLDMFQHSGSAFKRNALTKEAIQAAMETEDHEKGRRQILGNDCLHLRRIQKLSADARRRIVGSTSSALSFIKSSRESGTQIDYWNYNCMLLTALTHFVHLAEQHNRDIVPAFFELTASEFEEEQMEVQKQDMEPFLVETAKANKQRLSAYLKLFAKFRNLPNVYQSARLRDVIFRLLARGDPKVQLLALEVVIAWRSPSVNPYVDNLRNLVDEVKFRDELSTFPLDPTHPATSIQPQHRAELLPVVLRILYGRAVARKGKGSSKAGMGARRSAVLSALAGLANKELKIFIDLLAAPFQALRSEGEDEDGDVNMEGAFVFEDWKRAAVKTIPMRKQLGYLRLLEDVQKQLAGFLQPFAKDLFCITLYLVDAAHAELEDGGDTMKEAEEGLEEQNGDDEEEGEHGFTMESNVVRAAQIKDVRQTGIRRLTGFFKLSIVVDYSRFLPSFFAEVLSPRIAKLPMESTQAVSPLMELLCSWGARPSTAPYLVKYDADTMPKLLACLSAKKVRDAVISAVLEIVENVLAADENRMNEAEDIEDARCITLAEQIVVPHLALLLDSLEHLLHRSAETSKLGRDNFSRREISILSRVAPYVRDSVQAAKLVELLLPHLRKPPRIVPEKVKADILRVVESFFPLIPALNEDKSPLLQRYYGAVSVLFASLASRECRSLLHRVLERLSEIDSSLQTVAGVVGDLNAYSKRRIDEPDFDRRLAGFARINEELYMTISAREWIPILHNLLFLINDPEELSIRNNSTYALTKFIDRVVSATGESSEHEELLNLLTHIVYPGIKKRLRSHNENVRVELVNVLAHAVKKCPELPQFSDMVCLLAGGDEEASFFINVHHLQLHRRIRALRRLADECEGEARIRPNTLVHIIMPIVSHFIFETDRQGDHNLINETVRCLGVMSKRLPWSQYYSMLRGYLGLIPKKPELEKILVRLVISILDNFHFDISKVEDNVASKSKNRPSPKAPIEPQQVTNEDAEVKGDVQEDSDEEDNEEIAAEVAEEDRARKIHDTVVQKLLPELYRYLTNRDDTTVTVRVPVALAITKLLQELSVTSMEKHLPGLLTSVCQILRSRQQEARDSTRDTLVKIATRLGPAYFGFILTELRGALTRGYQLHVLGFTTHSLLESLGGEMEVGALDYCIEPLVSVLVADVFGEVGVEKETQEITGKMKEAKSMRSYESFEMLARTMSFIKIGLMLVPIKDLLRESENAKVTKKVDEALRRISVGLNSNTRIEAKDFLIFCHGLITENVELSKAASVKKASEKSQQEKNFEVQTKRSRATEIDHFSVNAHRFVEFGLNLLQSFLKKGRVDTKSAQHLALLEPFVAATVNATYSKHTRVVEVAVKLLSSLIRLPLAALEKGVPVVVRRLFQLIQESSGTTSDLVQACFKLLAVAIRENNKVVVTRQQLTFLVQTIRPDLEEPERQGTTFSLIRAIISRKFVTDEVYDLMEEVSQIMVTNQSSQVRELCRNVHLQFLLDYPHGKTRIRSQMAFLIKNLTYVHESGRTSVLEMLHAVVGKFPDDVLLDHADALFLALVLVLVNDEAAKCREMAGALIKSLMLRMESAGKLDRAYRLLQGWMRQGQQQRNLARTACQVYGLMIETFGERFVKQINTLLTHLQSTLEICNELLRQAEEGSMLIEGQDAGDDGPTAEWELAYYSLTTFSKLVRQFPALVHQSVDANAIWKLVSQDGIMLHPHSWVRLSSARLLGLYFSGVDPKTRKLAADSPKMLELLEATSLRQIAYQSSVQLKSQRLGDELATQATKNLVFLGRCMYYLPVEEGAYVRKKDDGDEEEDREDLEVETESTVTGATQKIDNAATKAREEVTALANLKSLLQFVKKISFMARQAQSKNESVKQRTCIFQWFAAMTSIIPAKELFPYLLPMIGPIYRTVMDETAKGDAVVELKNMSQEVLDLIQKKAGTTDYLYIHNNVRQRISQIREERKQKRVVQAIVDPEARAKRKLARNVTKRNGRKRKSEEFAKSREKFSTVKKRKH